MPERRTLPPLKSLVYFEAAARLQSFTRASTELNVTQGAVSRQIRQLEDFLGRPLFQRDKRQVMLTDDGHNYQVSIAHLLQELKEATRLLVSPAESGQVNLATSSAVASMYLLPRLPAFRSEFSDIQIRLVANDVVPSLEKPDFDLALYYARKPPEGCHWHRLFGEQVFPVCSPDYLADHAGQFDAEAGLSENLIWMESPEDWINWPEWLESVGIAIDKFTNRLVVNHYSMVIQAAIAGQGVALAWSRLVDAELERGALVRPTELSLETEAGFYLMLPINKSASTETIVFSEWLKQNCEADTDSIDNYADALLRGIQ